MRLVIAGTRTFDDYRLLCDTLAPITATITEVVSGGAKGADALGERWAREHNIPIKLFPANWKKYGPSAGPRRNKEMIQYAEGAVCFWDGRSPGTCNTIALAKQAYSNGTCYVIEYKPSIQAADA